MTDLAALYEAEYQPMVRLARLLTGSLQLAEEAVQDAFLTVHRRSATIEKPGAYLRRTVINNCYGQMRRAGTEHRKLALVDRPSDNPVLPPELDETWRALAALKPKQRTALVLRYYEDLSVRDVAELMDEKEGTVKSLVHRGIQALRAELSR